MVTPSHLVILDLLQEAAASVVVSPTIGAATSQTEVDSREDLTRTGVDTMALPTHPVDIAEFWFNWTRFLG